MLRCIICSLLLVLLCLLRADGVMAQARGKTLSHPPLRKVPQVKRPLAKGPAYYVDAQRGDNKNDGSAKSPWRTVQHAVSHLKAGDTLYLRGGRYYENVYLALAGRKNAPITIRSYPGETAFLDGGLREFFTSPADSWVPYPQGGKGEFRSKKRHPNLRHALGSFGDSMIGLQTYYHAKDFRADNELVDWQDWDRRDKTDLKPLYLGPGLWYDKSTGYIHVRLSHTHMPKPVANYRGETDPRKLPLVIAAFGSVPLHIDGARHIRLQDIVIAGAGYTAVEMEQADHVEFDNVTIWCGTYGIRARGAQHFRFLHSGLYGNVAPWTFRSDGSKRDYPGRPHRNISRLNTHALLEIESGLESSVYHTPYNDHWELAYSEFTDAHDGVYLGAINVKFHHNLIENMQDDGIYLSPMYYRHRLEKRDPELYIYQNIFRQVLTALAYGGPHPTTRDQVYIYRNIFDLRGQVNTGRPTVKNPGKAGFATGNVMGDHGSPPYSAMMIYHNTFAVTGRARSPAADVLGHYKAKHPRRVFNNIFFHFDRGASFYPPNAEFDVIADGNLYWSPRMTDVIRKNFFKRFRASPLYAQSKKIYLFGSTSHSLVADPLFRKSSPEPDANNDYRLQPNSPAINAGVPISGDWPDPLGKTDKGRPDIGAYPLGAEQLQVGRAVKKN